MGIAMEYAIKHWMVCPKPAPVLEFIRGTTKVAAASRQFDLAPSEIEDRVYQRKAGMENALRTKSEDVLEQHKQQLKELQDA